MSLELLATGGGQRHSFNQRPFVSPGRKEAEYERRWKTRWGGVWGNERFRERDTDVPRMSRHKKRPVISPGDGFRLEFKQQIRWNFITASKAECVDVREEDTAVD